MKFKLNNGEIFELSLKEFVLRPFDKDKEDSKHFVTECIKAKCVDDLLVDELMRGYKDKCWTLWGCPDCGGIYLEWHEMIGDCSKYNWHDWVKEYA